MKLILNEISIPNNASKLGNLVNDVLSMSLQFSENKFDDEQLKFHFHSSFLDSDFGNQFYNHIYAKYDIDKLGLFNSLIDCPTTESIISEFESDGKNLLKVTLPFKNTEIEGIGLKASTYYLDNSVLYSFNSDPNWLNAVLRTKAYTTATRFNHNDLKNFSNPELFKASHQILIIDYLKKQGWKPSTITFPFGKEARDCYKENRDTEILKKGRQEKTQIYRRYGELFANMNGYVFNDHLSKINTTDEKIRDIYIAGNSNHTRFISIDVENGGFELCDYDGTHLRTCGWLGEEISAAKIKTHSIKLSK